MAPPKYETRELSKETWSDFQDLFRRKGEWGACWCVYYQRERPPPQAERESLTLEQRAERNRIEKRKLVSGGRAHGILVYDLGRPVGWCQYGPKEEAPRIDRGRKYRKLDLGAGPGELWRITCFSVDRAYRNRGVASAALDAALNSIRKKGGGTVEAYPVTNRGALAAWFGSVPMFEKRGFRVVASFGKSNALMRKELQG